MRKFLPILSLFFLFSCQNEKAEPTANYLKISGETMGTTYHITYSDSLNRNFKPQIDSLLVDVNQAVSTYIEDSDISLFNKLGKNPNQLEREHFSIIFFQAGNIFIKTDGYFDPTVMPLVNYWGFGYTPKKSVTRIDSVEVDSLKKLVGFEKINAKPVDDSLDEFYYSKKNQNIQLDFSALAKGYGVDVVGELLQKNNIQNYLVEIGGEMIARGKNPRGEFWTTAINTPKINARLTDYEAIVSLNNKAIATSGNYRNFHEINGDWYGHTINPKTGFPEKSNLLSVSVLAETCMTADGYATAFMVMGLEKSKVLVEQLDDIDAFFIYANENGELEQTYTKGFEGIVK